MNVLAFYLEIQPCTENLREAAKKVIFLVARKGLATKKKLLFLKL